MVQIVSASLGLTALREAGYRNTASAVAELVDNSIEANATNIQIIAINRDIIVKTRSSRQIHQIAVVDDGVGMSTEILQNCLSLGWGTRLDKYEGLGRFGFGLKGASISQARRVEVYSWQNQGSVYRAYLDLDDVALNNQSELPEIEISEIPNSIAQYLNSNGGISNSGTIVLWDKIDKIDLKRTETLLNRMNNELCRIYRHYLDDDDTYGKRVWVDVHSINEMGEPDSTPKKLLSNDPLYLLTPNNLPDYESVNSNELLENYDLFFESPGGSSKVHIRFSVALPEVQALGGNSLVGKHYAKNTGISVLRAGREIQLSSFGFIDRSEPRHRWWGMEIRFEPALDHVFGITNNKQEVRNLRRFDEAEIEALHETKESEDDFTSAEIDFKLKLNDRISEHISQCMGIIRGRREGTRTSATRNPIVEVVNMEVSADGSQTISAEESSNKEISTKLEERKTLLLVDDETLTEGEAVELAEKTIDYRIDVQTGAWPGDLFLDNRLAANAAVAVINREHPFYDHFWNYLEQETDTKGFEALEVLLMAYCRAEDELAVRIDRKHFEAFRNRWGSWVRQLIGHSGS